MYNLLLQYTFFFEKGTVAGETKYANLTLKWKVEVDQLHLPFLRVPNGAFFFNIYILNPFISIHISPFKWSQIATLDRCNQ